MYIDLHTHIRNKSASTTAIVSTNTTLPTDGTLCSAGIHPWDIHNGWQKEIEQLRTISHDKRVVAIGECGIDKVKSPASIEVQKEVLKAHATIAEEAQKPLILHCVKGLEEIIALHKEIKPQQAWIVHGFRGKPEQATQLLREGLYLSFGEKFNEESLATTPPDKFFIESDTSSTPIEDIYKSIASKLQISIEELCHNIKANALSCNISI